VLYLEASGIKEFSPPLQIFLQTVAFVLAFLTCLSRIADNKHFWSDVLSGVILGAAIAAYMVRAGCLLVIMDYEYYID
jgi:membrane-associated phospholipid phosphatase